MVNADFTNATCLVQSIFWFSVMRFAKALCAHLTFDKTCNLAFYCSFTFVLSLKLFVGEAVFARCLSSIKDERLEASKHLTGPQITFEGDRKKFVDDLKSVRTNVTRCRPQCVCLLLYPLEY